MIEGSRVQTEISNNSGRVLMECSTVLRIKLHGDLKLTRLGDKSSDGEYVWLLVTDKKKFCLGCFASRRDEKLFEKIVLNQHNFI